MYGAAMRKRIAKASARATITDMNNARSEDLFTGALEEIE
jgi:hypothetical protein